MKRLLLIDDDPFSPKMLEDVFREEWKIITETNLDLVLKKLDKEEFHVILLNASTRRTDVEMLFDVLRKAAGPIPIITYTQANHSKLGRSLVKKGAFWNLTMPLNTDDLGHAMYLATRIQMYDHSLSGDKDFTQLEDGIARMFAPIKDKFPANFTFEEDVLVQGFVELLADIIQVDKASLMLLNPETNELRIKAAKGLTPYVIQNSVRKLGEGIAGWVAKEGKPLLIKDVQNDPNFSESVFYHQYTTKSLVCVPLKAGERVVGVLSANNHLSGKPFDEKDLYLTTIFAHLLLLTLYSAQLHYDRGKVYRWETELSALNRKITATLEPKVLFHVLLNECSSMFKSEFAFLFLLEEKGAEWTVHYLDGASLLESKLSPALLRQWLPHRGEPILLSGEPEKKEFEILRNLLKRDIRSWISAPLILQDRLAGSIELASLEPGGFREDDKSALSRLSQQASLAINNARLYTKLLYSIKEISDARKEVDRVRRGQFL